MMWQYYGLALTRAGDLAGAAAAYTRGIELLASGCRVSPNAPQWRETSRLILLQSLLNITPTERRADVIVPMFEPAVPALRSWGPFICVHDRTGSWIERISSGTRYALVKDGTIVDPDSGASAVTSVSLQAWQAGARAH
jgi:hypothetical protein